MKPIEKVAVVGAGIMGEGIASAIFRKGLAVNLFDLNQEMLNGAVSAIKKAARRNMDTEKVQACTSIADAVQDVDLVIEAIVENLDIKQQLFGQIDQAAPAHTILASNTSSLAISDIAQGTKRKEQVIGLHFFNPAVIMRLVEIIKAEKTSEQTVQTCQTFVDTIRKTGVLVKESPGFVVNRILVPLVNEAFFLLDEFKHQFDGDIIQTASHIDAALEAKNVLLMGPFNLVDMIGIDTAFKVAEIIYAGFDNHPRYLPSSLFRSYFDQQRYGRKKKRGVYNYQSDAMDPDQNPGLDEKMNKVETPDQPNFNPDYLTACMVNEAFRLVEEEIVGSYKDVEICIELGARWPKGPFALAKEMGCQKAVDLLTERYEASGGQKRYEPSRLLLKPSDELAAFFAI